MHTNRVLTVESIHFQTKPKQIDVILAYNSRIVKFNVVTVKSSKLLQRNGLVFAFNYK